MGLGVLERVPHQCTAIVYCTVVLHQCTALVYCRGPSWGYWSEYRNTLGDYIDGVTRRAEVA